MAQEAVIVAPQFHKSQCRMWDCGRILSSTLYCSFGHGLRSKTEEDKTQAAVYVDILRAEDEASLTLKILTTKSEGQRCGVPTLPILLQGDPTASPDIFNFQRMEDETNRNWLFLSNTVPPPDVWERLSSCRILGMEMVSFQLNAAPANGWYRLRRYTLPTYANSLYWLYYEWRNKGKKRTRNTVSAASVPKTKKGLQDPDRGAGAGAGASTSTKDKGGAGPCNKIGTDLQDLSLNHSAPSLLSFLSRALKVSGRIKAEDAVQATLSWIAWDTVGLTSLSSEDSVSELRRKLRYLEIQDEWIKECQEDLKRINKGVISGEEDKPLQEMTI